MQFYYLTQAVTFVNLIEEKPELNGGLMETLTLFIDQLYSFELGSSPYQHLEKKSIVSNTYNEVTVSGSLFEEVIFEDVIFDQCTFYANHFNHCLFLNCLFINCNFQFTKFSDCNFELTSWENCLWGLSASQDIKSESQADQKLFTFESTGSLSASTYMSLGEFLALSI